MLLNENKKKVIMADKSRETRKVFINQRIGMENKKT